MIKFKRESRGEKLWVPGDSQAAEDKEWVDDKFPTKSGQGSFIFEDANVLTKDVIIKVSWIYKHCIKAYLHGTYIKAYLHVCDLLTRS